MALFYTTKFAQNPFVLRENLMSSRIVNKLTPKRKIIKSLFLNDEQLKHKSLRLNLRRDLCFSCALLEALNCFVFQYFLTNFCYAVVSWCCFS